MFFINLRVIEQEMNIIRQEVIKIGKLTCGN